jgi:opacity protein-like surface antigen
MHKFWYCLLLAIPASLCCTISAQAEEVSAKAKDLIPINNNETITSEQKDISVAQNISTENSTKLPEKNYWYLSGSVGAGFPNDIKAREEDFSSSVGVNTGFQANVAAGYQWDQVRAELELGYASNDVNNVKSGGVTLPLSGNLSATTVFVNGYWDIPTGSQWRPYVGAGIGVGFPNSGELKSDGVTGAKSGGGTALALQGKAGIEYEIAKKSNVFLELKYQNIGGFSTGSGEDKVNYDSLNSFGATVGYRQGF